MSRRSSRRRQRDDIRPFTGLVPELLSLPARRNVRWRFIAAVMTGTALLYLHVLLTAPPLPPSKVPAPGTPAAVPAPVISTVQPPHF